MSKTKHYLCTQILCGMLGSKAAFLWGQHNRHKSKGGKQTSFCQGAPGMGELKLWITKGRFSEDCKATVVVETMSPHVLKRDLGLERVGNCHL